MKDKECNCCEDAKFGVAYIDPESGLLCSKIDTGMKLQKEKKFLHLEFVLSVEIRNGRQLITRK